LAAPAGFAAVPGLAAATGFAAGALTVLAAALVVDTFLTPAPLAAAVALPDADFADLPLAPPVAAARVSAFSASLHP